MREDIRKARRAGLWVGLVIPLVVIIVATALMLIWLPELPDPTATHWSFSGADGFGPAWTFPVTLLALGGGTVILLWCLAAFTHRPTQQPVTTQRGSTRPETSTPWSAVSRFLCAGNLGLSLFLSSLMLISVAVQRGLENAADAPNVTPWAFLGFIGLAGVTAVGWFVQPAILLRDADVTPDAAPLPLSATERAAWMGTASFSRVAQLFFIGSVAILLIPTTIMWMNSTDVVARWLMVGSVLLVAVLGAMNGRFRVRINNHGLLVKSSLGWPKIDIPAADITSVRTLHVQPLGEFGGWGWRKGLDGRTGIVLRAGEGIEVARKNGRTLVITIDDADTAASVLARVSGLEENRNDA